ncbi:MAG: hypothetical protein KJ799_14890 [Bacteroidetes bacterium]|nr:hypothetical protein [Bacteroidota bacterium]MBU1677359.1 hypothetical protein [Bacteroidota bacterium]MBU2507991.1 hypothetical protein [Bacteroidota bacterium]
MKKYLLFGVLVLFVIGCGNDKTNEKTDVTKGNEKAEEIVESVRPIVYKFEKGKALNYKMTTILSNTQSIQADTLIKTEMIQNAVYLLELMPIDIGKDNVTILEVFVKSIKVDANINGESMKYNSALILSDRERKFFVDYESMKKKKFRITVNKSGKILNISNTKSIADEMLAIQDKAGSFTKEQMEQFIQELNSAVIRPFSEQLIRELGKEEMGINSSWEKKYNSMLAGFSIENSALFTLTGIENRNGKEIANISAQLSVTWKGQNQVSEQGVNYFFSDPDISGSGSLQFNLDDGLLEKSQTTMRMGMEVTMRSSDANQMPVTAVKKDMIVNSTIIEKL